MKRESFNKFCRALDKVFDLVGEDGVLGATLYHSINSIQVSQQAFDILESGRHVAVTPLQDWLKFRVLIDGVEFWCTDDKPVARDHSYTAPGTPIDFDAIEPQPPQPESVVEVLSEQTIWREQLRGIVETIETEGVRCNCDLDNWEPEPDTGHSCVCRIHKIAMRRWIHPQDDSIAAALPEQTSPAAAVVR